MGAKTPFLALYNMCTTPYTWSGLPVGVVGSKFGGMCDVSRKTYHNIFVEKYVIKVKIIEQLKIVAVHALYSSHPSIYSMEPPQ